MYFWPFLGVITSLANDPRGTPGTSIPKLMGLENVSNDQWNDQELAQKEQQMVGELQGNSRNRPGVVARGLLSIVYIYPVSQRPST